MRRACGKTTVAAMHMLPGHVIAAERDFLRCFREKINISLPPCTLRIATSLKQFVFKWLSNDIPVATLSGINCGICFLNFRLIARLSRVMAL